MAAFGGLILTNRGRNLQAKAQAGAQLNFSRIAIGDGELSGSSVLDLKALRHEVESLNITKLKPLVNGKAVVGTILSNQGLATGFYFREIGVFAQDPDLGEILYCYGNAGANAEYIPAKGGPDIIEKYIDVIVIVGNASNVSATIDSSLVHVTYSDFEDHARAKDTHGVGAGYYIAKTSRTDQLPAYEDLQGKPTSFPPSAHKHTKNEITDFPTSIAPTAHKDTHANGGSDVLKPDDIGAVPTSRNISTNGGLTGGGTLATDKVLSIADGGVTDAKIGNRTISDTVAPTGNTGTLTVILGWIANMIKSITGKTNWWNAPDTTLAAAKSHIDAAAPHSGHETPAGAQTKANAAETAAKAYTNQEVASLAQEVDEHLADDVQHVTAGERTYWDSKAEGNHIHEIATSLINGFMSSSDKSKLDGVEIATGSTAALTSPQTIVVGFKPRYVIGISTGNSANIRLISQNSCVSITTTGGAKIDNSNYITSNGFVAFMDHTIRGFDWIAFK